MQSCFQIDKNLRRKSTLQLFFLRRLLDQNLTETARDNTCIIKTISNARITFQHLRHLNQYKANITFIKGEENLVQIKFTIMETEALNASLETKFIHQVILQTESF